jgi:Leucine-rich repeat (LRR) protein
MKKSFVFIFYLVIGSNLIVCKELNKNVLFQKYGYSLDSVYIDLSAQSINSIDSTTFDGFKSLKMLFLDDNKLTELNPHMFENLFQLKEISLESNNIQSLDSNLFSGLDNLEKICLNDNPISKLNNSSEINKLCGSNPKCTVKLNEKCSKDLILFRQDDLQDQKLDQIIGLIQNTLKKVEQIENTTSQLQNEQTKILSSISMFDLLFGKR